MQTRGSGPGFFLEGRADVKKEFVPYDTIRNNALKLAHRIHTDGFIPDVIYVSLRGGAYLGNIISEYFKIIRSGGRTERPAPASR